MNQGRHAGTGTVKFAAVVVVLALTAMPVASCGPIDFMGHELLRNEPPDVEELGEEMQRALQGGAGGEATPGSPASGGMKRKDGPLFEGDDAWMHWLYVAIFASAVLAFFLPRGSRLLLGIGAFGIVGLIVFLNKLEDLMGGEAEELLQMGGIDWEIGAWLALIGFGWFAVAGLRAARGGAPVRPSPRAADDQPPPTDATA